MLKVTINKSDLSNPAQLAEAFETSLKEYFYENDGLEPPENFGVLASHIAREFLKEFHLHNQLERLPKEKNNFEIYFDLQCKEKAK